VADGTVFIGCRDANVYALDAVTGEEEWTFQTGDRVPSSPAVADDTVFIGSHDNNVYALDAVSGERQWAFRVSRSVFSSPMVVDGTLFVGSYDGNLYAIDAGVAGSSEGSRVSLGTLGHHDGTDDLGADNSADDSGPGFGIGSTLAGLGSVVYLLHRRLIPSDTYST